MRSNDVHDGIETRAYLFPSSGFDSGESDADLIAEPDLATLEVPCDNYTDSADFNEAIVWLLPEIPGWEEYYKELEAVQ